MKTERRYLDGTYLKDNPDWDRADSHWKAQQVFRIITSNHIQPLSICEVGCGSGDILRYLRALFPMAKLVGYDISPQLDRFWSNDCHGIEFYLADFHKENTQRFDVILMLDVFEHVRDPFTFLELSRGHASNYIFHIPLDLNALSVLRQTPLLDARRKVGHLHSYTKDLALETLKDCGYSIKEWRYTGASSSIPNRLLKTRLADIPRRLLGYFNKDLTVRFLGGETLIVLAN